MVPDYNEDMVKDFEIYNRTVKHEGILKIKHFKNKNVSPWEITIYNTIRSYTKHYDYILIKNLLNDNEIPTFSGKIGCWTWETVRSIVRRVEDHLGIESKERYCLAIRSHDFKLMMKRMVLEMKEKNPSMTHNDMANQFNIHKYPYMSPDVIGKWTARQIGHIIKARPKKNSESEEEF